MVQVREHSTVGNAGTAKTLLPNAVVDLSKRSGRSPRAQQEDQVPCPQCEVGQKAVGRVVALAMPALPTRSPGELTFRRRVEAGWLIRCGMCVCVGSSTPVLTS